MAYTVAGIPVWPGNKTLDQIVAPVKSIIEELTVYIQAQNDEAEKQAKLALEAAEKQLAAQANAKLATAQADKLRELIIV